MDNDKILEEIERKKNYDKSIKKRIITLFFSISALIAVLCAAIAIWNSGWFVGEVLSPNGGYIFEPDYDYEYDIMKDEIYLELITAEPFITLENAQTGISESISPDEYETRGEAVAALTGLVKAIQMGDSEKYNSYFSRAYFIAEGKRKANSSDTPEAYENYTDDQYALLGREDVFTMQQIYSVHITFISEQSDPSTDIKTYIYELKYKIRQNNGTFRTDMGSDVYRTQKIVLSESTGAEDIKITSVSNYSYNLPTKIVHGWRIALVISLALVLIAGDVLLTVMIIKRIGRVNLEAEQTSNKAADEEDNDEKALGD